MYIAGTTTWGLLALAFSLVLDIESVCSTGNDKTNQNNFTKSKTSAPTYIAAGTLSIGFTLPIFCAIVLSFSVIFSF